MPTEPLNLAVVVGSTREGRRGPVVADWVLAQLKDRPEFSVDLVDLPAIELPSVLPAATTAELDAFDARLQRADAFIVVTPEYNHSYPAPLKHAIDVVKVPWHRKAVAFVSYGGVSGGLRAVEHLRGVFAELHAVTVRETVSFHGPWNGFTADGQPGDPASATQAMAVLLDDLAWWAEALRAARTASTAPAGTTEPDTAAIRELVDAAQAAQFDVDPFLRLHTDDAIVVNFGGRRVVGKAALGEAMSAAMASPLAQVATTAEVHDVRYVRPDVAIVSATKHVHDGRGGADALPSTRGSLTYVVAKEPAGWRIALAQTTPIAAS